MTVGLERRQPCEDPETQREWLMRREDWSDYLQAKKHLRLLIPEVRRRHETDPSLVFKSASSRLQLDCYSLLAVPASWIMRQ